MFFDINGNVITTDLQAQQLYVQQHQGYHQQPMDQVHEQLLQAIDDLAI